MSLPRVFAAALLAASVVGAAPVDRSGQTPDFTQTDPAAGFPRDGGSYCGPVAASNALLYLAQVGFDRFRPAESDAKLAQVKLIKSVADDAYMGTSESAGTSIPQFLSGLKKYVEDVGYVVRRFEHQGWRSNPKENPRKSDVPTAEFIRGGLAETHSAVLLNVGWYRFDAAAGTYTRIGGHWITAVGTEGDELLVHDPSPRSPKGETERFKFTPVTGKLVWKTSSGRVVERDAAGFSHLAGIKVRDRSDVGIIDAAVVIVLEPPGTAKPVAPAPATQPAGGK